MLKFDTHGQFSFLTDQTVLYSNMKVISDNANCDASQFIIDKKDLAKATIRLSKKNLKNNQEKNEELISFIKHHIVLLRESIKSV